MPRHVVDLVSDALNERGTALKGARVAVFGVAFKPNVGDPRNAPAANVLAGLAATGAEVRYHDPHVASFRDAAGEVRETGEPDELLAWADVVVALVAHRAIDWDLVFSQAELVVDTVNSSYGRKTRDRQVLRLGAGWSTDTPAD